MTSYPTGTTLTCGHQGCGCRVRVEAPCSCVGAGQPYRCTCGEEMVVVDQQ